MQAIEQKQKRAFTLSPIWIAPIIAIIIAGILVWNNLMNRGPIVEVFMDESSGIVPGKTEVRFRSVKIGYVQKVHLSDDYKRAVATIQMSPGTESLLVEDSAFWLVKPRLSVGQVSGLDTLLSGAYLQLYRGKSTTTVNQYELATSEPIDSADNPGRKYRLRTADKRQLNSGDPILYSGYEVGRIQNVSFDINTGFTTYDAFIFEPYTKFVDSEALFYNYGGVNVYAGVDGVKVDIDTLDHIIRGGIIMDHDSANTKPIPVQENHVFELYPNKVTAMTAKYKNSPAYVFFMDKDLLSMHVGSKVHINGIEVGEVTDIGWYENENYIYSETEIPVKFRITRGDTRYVKHLFADKLQKGQLCAVIDSSTILHSNDIVNLDLRTTLACKKGTHPDFRGLAVVPSIKKQNLFDVFDSLSSDLKKINLSGFSQDTRALLKSLSTLTTSLTKTVDSVNQTKTINHIGEILDQLSSMLQDYRSDTDLRENLEGIVTDLRKVLRMTTPLMREMQQKSNSLVFESVQNDVIPQKKR